MTPFVKKDPVVVIENDPEKLLPGFGWPPSQECLDEIKAIEDNIAWAMANAKNVRVD